jgi:glutathione synthase/RimK-type ligase-like ATP-grasp enzyme
VTIGIADRAPTDWVEEFQRACDQLQLPHKLVQICRHDWTEQLYGVQALFWRIHLGDQQGLLEARRKIPVAEQMGIACFPNRQMAELYDDKIRQAFFFRLHHYPTPRTFVSFSRDDILTFLRGAEYPLVAKTSGGASSSGVALLRDRPSAERLVRFVYQRDGLIKRCADRFLRRARRKSGIQAAYRVSAQRQREQYVILQQWVPSDGDLRVATLGPDIVAAFWRKNRPNDFRASGSGLLEPFTEQTIPKVPCDLALQISEKHGFTSMAYDFLPSGENWLITEISYSFILKREPWNYTHALFRRLKDGYQKIPPTSLGVLHMRAVLDRLRTDTPGDRKAI